MDFEKYIDHLDQDRREMEQRITEERRLSEERIEKRSSEFEERLEKRFISIDQRFMRIEDKIDSLSDDVHKENKGTRQWMMATFFTVVAMVLASIFGIVAIVLQLLPSV